MGYQDIHGTPSFFIDYTAYLGSQNYITKTGISNVITKIPSVGAGPWYQVLNNTDPGHPHPVWGSAYLTFCDYLSDYNGDYPGWPDKYRWHMTNKLFDYLFVLNHNLGDSFLSINFADFSGDSTGSNVRMEDVHNGGSFSSQTFGNIDQNDGTNITMSPPSDGFSVGKFIDSDSDNGILSDNIVFSFQGDTTSSTSFREIGSIILAKRFDMPIQPHMNYSVEYKTDSVKKVTSITGQEYVLNDNLYNSSSAFQVRPSDKYTPKSTRGKRVFNLVFKNIVNATNSGNKPSLFPALEAGNNFPRNADGYTDGTAGYYDDYSTNGIPTDENVLNSNSFIGRVWRMTAGFQNNFIFLPDKDNDRPDQYCLARIDSDSLTINQVANNVYEIALKIEEV